MVAGLCDEDNGAGTLDLHGGGVPELDEASRRARSHPLLPLTLTSTPLLLSEKKLATRGGRLGGRQLAVVDGLETARHLLDREHGGV